MQKNQKKVLWIGLSLIGIAVIILIIYFVRNSKKTCPDGSKVKKNQDCPKDESQVKQQESSGSSAPPPPVNNSFPLNIGARGSNVTNLQNALIKMGKSIPAGATGYFGSQTLSALQSAGYDAPVSADDYNNILAGKTKTSASAPHSFKNGDMLWAKVALIYHNSPDVNTSDNRGGRFEKGDFVGNWIGAHSSNVSLVQVYDTTDKKYRPVYIATPALTNVKP